MIDARDYNTKDDLSRAMSYESDKAYAQTLSSVLFKMKVEVSKINAKMETITSELELTKKRITNFENEAKEKGWTII